MSTTDVDAVFGIGVKSYDSGFLDRDVMEKINDIESNYNVDSISSDTTKLWNLVRIVLGMSVMKPDYAKNENKNKMTKIIFVLKEMLSRTKYPKKEICAFSDVDSQKAKDGYSYDVYVDPLNEIFENYIVLDWASPKAKRNKTLKNHTPLKIPIAVLLEKIRPNKPNIHNLNILEDIVNDFAGAFNLNKEIMMKYVLESISISKIVKEDVRKKLEKIKPSIVIIRGAYGRFQMGVTQACRELNIPIIEIQHGLIYSNHFAYIKRKKSENRDYIPDMLLTWGDYFSDIVKKGYLFEKEKIKSVGFPYLEKMSTNKYPLDKKLVEFCKKFKTVILVPDQTTDYIDDFVRKASERNNEIGYIYKPHPRDERKLVFPMNNVISVERDIDIYSLFQYVDFTLSKSSTLILETLVFGVPSICLSTSYFDIGKMEIVDNKTIYLVNTVDEFIEILSKLKKDGARTKKKAEKFFKKDALSNIKEIIK